MRRDKIRFFVFDLLSFDILRIYLQKLVLYVLFIILTMIKGLKKWVVIRLFWGGNTFDLDFYICFGIMVSQSDLTFVR